jgi:CheY-like chemotaxis protein
MVPRVLVVDDHDDARELLTLIIETRGYRVVTASNGREAVEQARQARPDAIIMDLFMPQMDGYEAAYVIKAIPSLASVPIVAYSARSSPPDIDGGLFAACCIKPCSPEDLLETLERILDAAPRGAATV